MKTGAELMTSEQKHKRDFRASGKWKKFRNFMKKEQKVDQITKKPLLKGFNLHHLDLRDSHYEELEPEKFACLNKTTHEMVHFLFRYKNWREVLYNLSKMLTEMEKYRE